MNIIIICIAVDMLEIRCRLVNDDASHLSNACKARARCAKTRPNRTHTVSGSGLSALVERRHIDNDNNVECSRRRDQMAIICSFCSFYALFFCSLLELSFKCRVDRPSARATAYTHTHTQFFAYLPTIIGIIAMPTIRGEQ